MNRQLRSILEETEGGRRYLAQIDGEKRARARRRADKPKAPGRAKADRRAERKEAASKVRAAVVARAAGRCEAIHEMPSGTIMRCFGAAQEWDHFWGRRHAEQETVEGTWMLCCHCHGRKTDNNPSRPSWLASFWRHAVRHGYEAQKAKVQAAIEFERAQHPSCALEGRR